MRTPWIALAPHQLVVFVARKVEAIKPEYGTYYNRAADERRQRGAEEQGSLSNLSSVDREKEYGEGQDCMLFSWRVTL